MPYERNLILVSERRHMDPADFETIAALVRERCAEIEVFVVENGSLNMRIARQAAQRPTLVICPTPLDMFTPRRGRILQGSWIGKIEEMQRMEAAGLPVPRWTVIEPETRLDESEWGPAVIVKPAFGGQNRDINLVPTGSVRYQKPDTFPENHRGRLGPMIAQQFIHTGPRPGEYRVLTLCGRPLYAIKKTTDGLPPFVWPPEPNFSGRADFGSPTGDEIIEFADESDILTLAADVQKAMPDVATIGCDIVREAGTGRIFVLEANCKGFSWHLSSPSGRRQQAKSGLDFHSQFDSFSTAASILIDSTQEYAT